MDVPARTQYTEAEREAIKRLKFELARSEVATYTLKKMRTEQANQAPRKVIIGSTITFTSEFGSLAHRQNVTITAGTDVILQRLGPSSLQDYRRMVQEAVEGADLLDDVYDKACGSPRNRLGVTPSAKPEDQEYVFGALYFEGGPDDYDNIYLSHQTTQKYWARDDQQNEDGRWAVTDLMAWFNSYFERFVLPLLVEEGSGLCARFRAQLQERSDTHFPWVAEEVPGLKHLCLPQYSNLKPKKGFSSSPDSTKEEASPFIMINFGQHAFLELAEYNCSLELQPLDIVLYDPDKVTAQAVKHSQRVDPSLPERWSVTCYFQKLFQERQLTDDGPCEFYAKSKARRDQKTLARDAEIRAQEAEEQQSWGSAIERESSGATTGAEDSDRDDAYTGVIQPETSRSVKLEHPAEASTRAVPLEEAPSSTGEGEGGRDRRKRPRLSYVE
ncbi:hypothetical protein PSEUBRA_000367 [Kalmanozyma brasiliensis GHG001]|uniref:Uncharacterized protein n=1 Tax=Kalmanozyma brasiliensis (strain GHG001) TaxID=1365824 RepID=V5GVN7_KALBG|nr:uncharacterized protein PSEUBRA_000367 [Kalmanozyma brasiliensis GHG001]EST09967.1 hypothetical protein PSEUBRA_000367 [Kalmanozyma brasiliensis GHG001]